MNSVSTHRVLISNLAPTIDSSMLEDMFSAVGDVQRVLIHVDDVSGLSRGSGVVEMRTEEQAKDCILHFHGQKKEGRTLSVTVDRPPQVRVPKPLSLKTALRRANLKGRKANGRNGSRSAATSISKSVSKVDSKISLTGDLT